MSVSCIIDEYIDFAEPTADVACDRFYFFLVGDIRRIIVSALNGVSGNVYHDVSGLFVKSAKRLSNTAGGACDHNGFSCGKLHSELLVFILIAVS